MARDEEERLLERRRADKNSSKVPRKLCICLCCIVIVILAILLAVFLYYKFSKRSDSNLQLNGEDASLIGLNLTKVGHPKNLSVILENHCINCNKVKEEVERTNSHDYIYIIKTDKTLTDAQACAVESVLRLFPDKKIFLMDFFKSNSSNNCVTFGSNPDYLAYLHYLYKDRMEISFANKTTFFNNTPLQNFSTDDDKFEFLAILIAAYRYGGFVTSSRMVMTNRDLLECPPQETIVEPFAIIAAKRFDEYLLYLLESFGTCGPGYQSSLQDMLLKSAELYSKTGGHTPRRLEPQEVCDSPKEYCTFLKARCFKETDTKLISDLSAYCKQVITAFLGVKINKLEVEEETSMMRKHIAENKKICSKKPAHVNSCPM